jgi:NADH:ubiquinone oxidoreductase subunit 6 (subunit J)
MIRLIIFMVLAVVILGSAVMSVATKRIMRAATFLLFVLFGVAGIYFLLDYTFLGAVQISVYAGGVTMLYIFAIALTNKNMLSGLYERLHGGRVFAGAAAALVGLAMILFAFFKEHLLTVASSTEEIPMATIGHALMGSEKYQYVLPFEFISVFLLACIIGGILISRKE